jgi:competence protein ComEC
VALGSGCALYFALRVEPPLWTGVAATAAGAGLWLAARRLAGGRWPAIAAALLTFLAAGLLLAQLRTRIVAAPVIAERGSFTVEGWVVDVASPGSGGGRLVIAPFEISGLEPDRIPRRVRVTVGPDALTGPGQAVRLRAVLGPPPDPASPGAYDFARDSYFQGIGAVGFSLSDPQVISGPQPPLLLRAAMAVNAARWRLSRRIVDALGPRQGGVAAAMTTGHEAWLQPDDVQAMRDAGISHILSISGVHMAIVGGFVFFLARALVALWPWAALRAPGKKLAAGAGLAATALYLVVSGAPPPAVRSAVTLSVAFLAILADRRAISLHALALAALLVLALQPEAVVQPGFQMSFAATAALVALAELWRRPPREINAPWWARLWQGAVSWLAVGIAASLVAGLATTPFAVQHFNRVSLYGLPANLLMEPLSTFVIMPALAAGALLEGISPGLGAWLLQLAGWGVGALLALAQAVASWPKAAWITPSAPDVALPVAFLGLLFVCLWKGRLRWLGLPFAFAVTLWPRPPAPDAWVASDGGAAAVREGRAAVFLRPDAKQFAADLWARRRGLDEPKDPEAARDARFDCSRRECLPLPTGEGPRLAAWWVRRAPGPGQTAELCAGADIVVVRDALRFPCDAPVVLTGQDFSRGGSAELFRIRGGWRVDWANDVRGNRPWTHGQGPKEPGFPLLRE